MIDWIKTSRVNSDKGYIVVSVAIAQSKQQNRRPHVYVRFSADAVSDLRLVAGDRVLVGYDKSTHELVLRRVVDGKGFRLSPGSSTSRYLGVSATANYQPTTKVTVSKSQVKIEGANTVLTGIHLAPWAPSETERVAA